MRALIRDRQDLHLPHRIEIADHLDRERVLLFHERVADDRESVTVVDHLLDDRQGLRVEIAADDLQDFGDVDGHAVTSARGTEMTTRMEPSGRTTVARPQRMAYATMDFGSAMY